MMVFSNTEMSLSDGASKNSSGGTELGFVD